MITEIIDILASAAGPENAVNARDIAAHLGMPERTVRRVIASPEFTDAAIAHEMVICSKPGAGFYLATQADHAAEARKTALGLVLAANDRLRRMDAILQASGFGCVIPETTTV